jgi:hypothetical protein
MVTHLWNDEPGGARDVEDKQETKFSDLVSKSHSFLPTIRCSCHVSKAPGLYFIWMDRRGAASQARGRLGHPVLSFFRAFHAALEYPKEAMRSLQSV